jgi:DNA-binding CsgD family transcriptional regulator
MALRDGVTEIELFERLTPKQRECLDLVLQRKTSKQIARILKVSKPAVDQRLATARQCLGAADRDDAAMRYSRMLSTYDRVVYDTLQLPPWSERAQEIGRGERPDELFTLHEAPTSFGTYEQFQLPRSQALGISLSELGTGARIAVMLGFAVGIPSTVLIVLAVGQSLSRLLSS